MGGEPAMAVVERLERATAAHDLDGIVACFSDDYVNETPAHPSRGFAGPTQVRTNWGRILGAVPDLSVSVLRVAVDGDVVWTEWEMRGTRPDGAAHLMRGVIIFEIDTQEHRARAARFFLEPVDHEQLDADTAVREILAGP